MLDADLKDQLASYLDRITQDVELSLTLDESETAAEIASLAEELRGLSPRISVVRDDAADVRKPSFSIGRPGELGRIRFVGVPLGHEFTSLVLALLHTGGHSPKAPAEIQDQIRALPGKLRFETFYSLSCHNCPDVVQALNLLATLNSQIEHVAIDGALVQAELDARQILGVPTVFLNGERFGQGRMELEEILAKLDSQHDRRKAERLNQKGVFDVLIVGGGPAGAAAAIYAARKGLNTGIVAERFGGQVLDTLAIENFISVPETQGPQFAAALEAHVKSYPVDLMNNQRAKRLIPGDLIGVELENGATLSGRSVVLATGAKWRDMNVPGEAEYRTKGVTYCPHCDGPLFKGQRVAVIGGGNSGVEAAIDLAGVVAHVTLLEFQPELRADAILQRKLRSLPNVEVIAMARTTEVLGDGQRVTGLKYEDRNTGEIRELELRGIFVQIGLLPSTVWLKGSVELSPMGEIIVDAKGQTSVPGVYAAGDATTVPYKQIIIATGDGAKAALGAFEHLIRVSAPAA